MPDILPHRCAIRAPWMSRIWDRLPHMGEDLDGRLAGHVARLRAARGWSLDDLAVRAGVSRSTLSRLERGEISPTTSLQGRLCSAYEISLSRLLAEVESEAPPAVLRHAE